MNGFGSKGPQLTCAAGGAAKLGEGKTVTVCVHVVVHDIGEPVCGLIGATVNVTVNVISVVPVLVNVNVGFWSVELLMVELPVPPEGGETVQLYCNAKGTPLHEGGCDVLLEATFNTEQPEEGVKVKAQVGGLITHNVSVSISSPQEFLMR